MCDPFISLASDPPKYRTTFVAVTVLQQILKKRLVDKQKNHEYLAHFYCSNKTTHEAKNRRDSKTIVSQQPFWFTESSIYDLLLEHQSSSWGIIVLLLLEFCLPPFEVKVERSPSPPAIIERPTQRASMVTTMKKYCVRNVLLLAMALLINAKRVSGLLIPGQHLFSFGTTARHC